MDLNEEVNIDQEFTDHEQSKQVLPVDEGQIEEDELSDSSIPTAGKDDTQPARTTGSPKRSGSPALQESTMRVVSPVKKAKSPARQASPAMTNSHGVDNLPFQSAAVPDEKGIKDPASQIWSIIQNTSKPSSMNLAPKSQTALQPIVNIDYLEAERKFNEFELKYQLIVNENKRLIKEKEEWVLEKQKLEQKLTLMPVKPASDTYELELLKKELLLAKQELNSRSASLTKVKRELETQSELALKIQSESSSLSYKVTLREEELRSKTLQIERLREELNQRNSFNVQQKQKDLEAFDSIRQELSKKTSENLSLESKANGLQNQLSLVEKELQSKHALIRDLQNEKLLAEQQFLDEIKSQKKLTQVYEEQYNQVVNDNEELKELVRKLDESVDKLQKLQYGQQQDHEKAVREARNQIEVQQNEIKNLKEQLSIVNSDLLKNSVSVQISHLSGTAAAANQIQKSGKSITEMFSEYSRLQVELASEKAEVSRLNECIARIVAEFEERAPMIQKTADEFQKSRKLVEQLSLQLQASIEEKEHAVKEKTITLAAMKEKENEIVLLSKEVQDRSRQVQVLLREQFLLKGGHHSAAPEVGLAAGEPHEADADQVISQRLVVFRNIEELQMQNSNLLRSIRSLSATLEEQEAQKSSNIESARLESIQETTAIIEQLKEQLQRERNSAEMYRKERNTWKALSENHAGHQEQVHVAEITRGEHDCEFKVNLAEIKEDFDIYRKESTANNKKLQFLLQQANDENAGINLQMSNLKNQILYLNERHDYLQKNADTRNNEYEKLQDMMNVMNSMSERQENKLTTLTNSLLSSQQELATIVAKYGRAAAELAISKETQQRLIGDKDEAIKEKNAANERIKELKQAYDEKIEGQSVEVSKLRDQLQELDRELKISRKQLLDVLDDQRSISERKEAEISQLKSQILKANRDLETSKEKIDKLLKKDTNAGKSVEVLLSKLSNLDDENRTGSSMTDDCKQLQDSLRAAKIEILNLKNEIALTKEESKTYKNISQTSETRLMEVSAASEKFQSDTAAVIESLNQRLDLAVRQKTELQLKIDELQAELKIAKEKSDNHDQIVAEIRSKFEKQIEISKEAQTQSQLYSEMLQNDLNTMKSTMTDLQANYEREVQNHSSAVSRVSSLRETITKLEGSHQEIIDEKNNAQKQLAEANMKYEQIEQRLSVEIRDLQERIDDLTIQNELLHAQFQQNAIESAQSISHDVQGSSNISEDTSKKLSNLMDLINHTQRQKNILQNKLDVSQRERLRLQLQMEQSEKSLDDALNLLEKQKNSTTQIVSAQKYQELLAKLENANLHRESNVTLRTQLEIAQKRYEELEKELASVNESVDPLKKQLIELKSSIDAKTKQIEKYKQDSQMWKTRADELLTKYNQIDPVEHENLKKKLKLLEDNHEKRETVVKNLQASIQKLKLELEIKEKELKITSQKLDINSKELEKQLEFVAELQDPSKNQEVMKLTERLEKIKNSSREIAAKDKSRRAQLKNQISALTAQNADLSTQLKQKILEHQDASKKLAELSKLYDDARKISGTISAPSATIPEKIEANKPPSKAIPIVKPAVGIQPVSEHKSSDPPTIPSASTAIIPNPFISPAKSTNAFSSTTIAFPNQIANTATIENTSTQPDAAIDDTTLHKVEATPKVGFSFLANPVSEVPSASTNIPVMETTSPSESLKRDREMASPVEVASKRAKVEELPDTINEDAPEEEVIDTDNDEEIDSDDEIGASSSDEDMYLLINSSESSAESTTIDGLIQDAAEQAVDTLDNNSKNGGLEPELHVDDVVAEQKNEPQETEANAIKSETTIPPRSIPVESAPKTAEMKVSINRQPATESKIVIIRPQTSASDLPKFSINRTPTIPTVPTTQDFIPVSKATTEVKPAATPTAVTVPFEEDKKALLLQKMAAFKRTHEVKPERGKKGRRGK